MSCSLVDQVLEFRVDEGEHDGAGPVQDGGALKQRSRFGAPGFRLEVEVDCVQRHGKEVTDQGHGFRRQAVQAKMFSMFNSDFKDTVCKETISYVSVLYLVQYCRLPRIIGYVLFSFFFCQQGFLQKK